MKQVLHVLLALVFAANALADTNVSAPYSSNSIIYFELRDAEGATPALDLEASATCATGDVKLIQDGGVAANSTNCFASEGNGVYSLELETTELDTKVTDIVIVDQTGTKVWVDKVVHVYTHSNASSFQGSTNVNVSTIDSGAITAAAIATDAIGASEIAADAIGASEIAASAIGASEIATNAITATKIATDAITAAKIAADSIGASEIAAGAIVKGTEITGFNDLSAANVNAEVVDALDTDTYAELASCPAATASISDMIQYLYMSSRNLVTDGSGTHTLYKDDGATGLCQAAVSDNGTTFTRAEAAAP